MQYIQHDYLKLFPIPMPIVILFVHRGLILLLLLLIKDYLNKETPEFSDGHYGWKALILTLSTRLEKRII